MFRTKFKHPFARLNELLAQLDGPPRSFTTSEVADEEIIKLRALLGEIENIGIFAEHNKWRFGETGMKLLKDLKTSCNQQINDANRQKMEVGIY